MSFIYREKQTSLGIVRFVLFFLLVAAFPAPVFAAASLSVFSGEVDSVSPCINVPDTSLVSFKNASQKPVLYQNGVSNAGFRAAMPQKGQYIYGTSLTAQKCLSWLFSASDQLISSFGSTTPARAAFLIVSARSNSYGSGGNGGFGSDGFPVLGMLQNLLSTAFSSIGGPSGSGSSGLGGIAGGVISGIASLIGGPFGGAILTPPIPCLDPPGSWIVTLGPPTPGIYKYIPGLSFTFLFGPPLVPSQWVLGNSAPELCLEAIGATPIPVKLIVMHGTSLPGIPGGIPQLPVGATPSPTKPTAPNGQCKNGAANLTGITGTTAYFPGYGGIEGGDVDARGHQTYTVQDYLNCSRSGSGNCQPITVATTQSSGIPLGTVVTWPNLVQQYNRTYGLNLPPNTPFVVNDHYASYIGSPTFDIAQCASHDSTCFNASHSGGSFHNLGNPSCPSGPLTS